MCHGLCFQRHVKLIFDKKSPFPEEKPALDANTLKMWTLSANDMDDDDVVSCRFGSVDGPLGQNGQKFSKEFSFKGVEFSHDAVLRSR